MWQDEQKADFLCFAFQEIHNTNRAIRERLYSIVNYSVTLFLVVSAFFLTQNPSLSMYVRRFTLVGVALMIVISVSLLNRAYANLRAQQGILAALEREMGFHTPGVYSSIPGPLFGTATAEKLQSPTYYKHTIWLYRTTVILIGLFAAWTIQVTH